MEKTNISENFSCSKIQLNNISGSGTAQLFLINTEIKYYSLQIIIKNQSMNSHTQTISVRILINFEGNVIKSNTTLPHNHLFALKF